MTIALRMSVSIVAFGLAVAGLYWFFARDLTGTVLLGVFGLGFLWVFAYLVASRKKTRLDGDEQRLPSELAGERIGVFSIESPWPVLLALASASFLIGVVLHPMLGAFAFVALLAVLWGLARESR